MASSNSSTGPNKGLPPARSAKRAAQQAGQPSDDPEVLASEIEKTREDLAETLDAIADKVSPKRVTQRTKKKVADTAKQGVHDAADTVKEKAAGAGESLKEAAGALKGKAAGAGESLKEVAGGTADASAPQSVPDVDGSMTSIEASGQSQTEFAIDTVPSKPGALTVTPDVQRPSVAPVTGDLNTDQPPSLKPGGQPGPLGPVAQPKGPMLAGAAAAVAVLLLLLRRRRR